jgi:hypothetical protein
MKYFVFLIVIILVVTFIFLLKETMTSNDIYSKEELIELGLHDVDKVKIQPYNPEYQSFDIIERLLKANKIILK